MDEYIDREHAGAVLWTTDAEIRYNLCGALERLNFDWDLFVQSGESLRLQGEFTSEDWLLMRDLASYLMYLVQQPTMDAYMQSRRAGLSSGLYGGCTIVGTPTLSTSSLR